jgi:hypothetical protein
VNGLSVNNVRNVQVKKSFIKCSPLTQYINLRCVASDVENTSRRIYRHIATIPRPHDVGVEQFDGGEKFGQSVGVEADVGVNVYVDQA